MYRGKDLLRFAENPFEAISAYIGQPQLGRFDNRADFIQSRQHAREAVVVVDRIRFDEP